MTRTPDNVVHLSYKDWLVIGAFIVPLVASYFQLSIAIASIEANQTHILYRLQQIEERQ